MKRSPWSWIPSLYVAEGLPYFAVNSLTVLLYTQLGVSEKSMAFYTGWLYLPWVVKPFWSPFVDLFSTKRRWTVCMQALMALFLAGAAFLIPTGWFFFSTLALFWAVAFFSATHDISADGFYMLALDPKRQAAFVGVRSTFYRLASILGQGGLIILTDQMARTMGDRAEAWSATFLIAATFLAVCAVWHAWTLPKPPSDVPALRSVSGPQPCEPESSSRSNGGMGEILQRGAEIVRGFGGAFASFYRKPGFWAAVGFILLYRFPEALCLKLTAVFLVSPMEKGGLGLSMTEVGLANGTIGVAALLGGGIVGGLAIARGGLRKWLWPMALALTLPCVVYCYMAAALPQSRALICTLIAVEQFGYGFGFTAFMMFLIDFARGPMQTSHYSICTAFMALGMMGPGMVAGWLYETLGRFSWFGQAAAPSGYVNFFWAVMGSCLLTYVGCHLALKALAKR